MYAYVDESGNTGNHIFDREQPLFITAAMMTRTNFDLVYKGSVAAITRKAGVGALHANELGVARIEEIAPDLLKLVKKADARFFISRIEKTYLATSKVFDTFFDAGENLAVPWHIYWVKDLRLHLMFSLASFVITEEIAATVWTCLTAKSEQVSRSNFLKAASDMLSNAPSLPDEQQKQIVIEALQWCLANPESFTTYLRDKVNRNAHSPNFVAFTNLMEGLDETSKSWKRAVKEIVHDEQSEFEKTLQKWHTMFSDPDLAGIEPIKWPGEIKPYSLSKTAGSRFRMAREETSPGLQVTDVVLWLFKRVVTDKEIGPSGARLLNRVFLRARQNDLSFAGIGPRLEASIDATMAAPQSEEEEMAGARLMAEAEERRISMMRAYVAQKAAGEGSSA